MSTQKLHGVILMLISPVIALVLGLKSQERSFKIWMLTAFVTIYGSTILLTEGSDGLVHQSRVYDHYVGLGFGQFLTELWGMMQLQPTSAPNDDLYIHILSYFTGEVLSLPGLFFTLVAFVYGYFFVRSLFEVIQLKRGVQYSWLLYGLIAIFILWRNLESINTVRTWTGLWVLFYGCIRYYRTGQWKYLLLMFAPPLIHVGYFIMAVPAWMVLFFKPRPLIYSVIFFGSFFISNLQQDVFLNQLKSNAIGQSKVDGYLIETQSNFGAILENYSKQAWYMALNKAGVQTIAVNLVAISMIIFGIYFRFFDHVERAIFSIGILTMALGNLTWYLYALSARSEIVGGLFILATAVMFYIREFEGARMNYFKIRLNILKLSLILFFPFIVFRIADMIYLISVYLFAMPFLTWIDSDVNISIRLAITKLFGF